MAQFVPGMVEIMKAHPETVWGDACYPVIEKWTK